jgi:hypothetical protein
MMEEFWGVLIRYPEVADHTELPGTKFKLGFRVQRSLFNDVLIPMCNRVNNIFRQKNSVLFFWSSRC